jgi:hypothetical protein
LRPHAGHTRGTPPSAIRRSRPTVTADRLSATEQAASRHRAANLEGAKFCVMLAFGAAAGLVAHEMEPHEKKEAGRRARRLLYSALHVMEAASDTPVAALGGDYYMPPGA